MIDLDGRAAIVTGGGSGIGAASAALLGRAGARVLVADLNEDAAGDVADRIRNDGGSAIAQRVDISDEAQVAKMVMRARDEFGRLDILDNNAALVAKSHLDQDLGLVTLDPDVWDRTFAVNARGTMLVARGALPLMLETGGGSIINIASAAGLWGDVRSTAYGSSKAAVIGLTRYIAAQHMNSGLRCNAIAPGVIATPAAGVLPPPVMETVTRHQMRLGEPEDIAGVVLFLASDLSAFVTGQVITVDGGLLVHSPMMPERAAMLRAASSENAEP